MPVLKQMLVCDVRFSPSSALTMIRVGSGASVAGIRSVDAMRRMATAAPAVASRKPKAEGSIADVFTSLSGEISQPLPARFSDLKKELFTEALVESWREVLAELNVAVEEVAAKGSDVRTIHCFRYRI